MNNTLRKSAKILGFGIGFMAGLWILVDATLDEVNLGIKFLIIVLGILVSGLIYWLFQFAFKDYNPTPKVQGNLSEQKESREELIDSLYCANCKYYKPNDTLWCGLPTEPYIDQLKSGTKFCTAFKMEGTGDEKDE